MTEFYFNGQKVTEDELQALIKESEYAMLAEEEQVVKLFGVSLDTAAAIVYLRSRSRWTEQKELLLIARDREGNPIPLRDVLSGEF